MSEQQEVRCPGCNRLLLHVKGFGCIIEIKCARCGAMVSWPSLRAEIVLKADAGIVVKQAEPAVVGD